MAFLQPTPSFWEQRQLFRAADFTVVGGGIVGINAALGLRELHPRARIVVVERGTLPAGASTRNAGFACFGSPGELLTDVDEIGWEATVALVDFRLRGLQRLRQRLTDAELRFRSVSAYELIDEVNEYQRLRDHLPHLNQRLEPLNGVPETYTLPKRGDEPLPGVGRAIQIHGEGQLDPAAMMDALYRLACRREIQILHGLELKSFGETGDRVLLQFAPERTLSTARLLLCTNGFTRKLLPELEVQPARNQVLVTEPLGKRVPRGNFHFERGYVYFRNVGDRLLLGGGRHRFGNREDTDDFAQTEEVTRYLQELIQERILLTTTPVRIDYRWSGILGVGSNRNPIVRRHSDRIGLAVRLGGMGVAIGTEVGEQAARLFA